MISEVFCRLILAQHAARKDPHGAKKPLFLESQHHVPRWNATARWCCCGQAAALLTSAGHRLWTDAATAAASEASTCAVTHRPLRFVTGAAATIATEPLGRPSLTSPLVCCRGLLSWTPLSQRVHPAVEVGAQPALIPREARCNGCKRCPFGMSLVRFWASVLRDTQALAERVNIADARIRKRPAPGCVAAAPPRCLLMVGRWQRH